MVQILPQYDPWGDAGRNVIKNLANTVSNRLDETALQNAIGNLPSNATGKDVMNALMKTSASPEAKQNALKNYIGVAQFDEVKRKAEKQQQAQERQLATKEAKNFNDAIKEANRVAEVKDKADKEQADKDALINGLDLPDDQKEVLRQGGSLKSVERILENQMKPKKAEMSPAEREFSKDAIKDYIQLQKDIPELQHANALADEVEKEFPEMNAAQYASSYLGAKVGTQRSKRIEGLSINLLKPALKVLAPSGPIIKAKLDTIKDLLFVQADDRPSVAKGKLEAIRLLNNQALERAQKRVALYEKYNFLPPINLVKTFDDQTSDIMDSFVRIGKDLAGASTPAEASSMGLPPASSKTGKTLTSKKTGKKFRSEGGQWIEVK